MIRKLIGQNRFLLEQGQEILEILPVPLYGLSEAETYGSSPGGHFRHIVQHYQAFLKDLPSGMINYDQRDRTSSIETSQTEASAAIREILARLRELGQEDREIKIIQNVNPVEGLTPVRSTISRELTFQISHTIHHYALIAVIMRLNGISTPRHFGFAPSTIYHHEGQAAVLN
ncbi:MAG: DinB family protein [Spirochaetales bacterium]|nr:DinB family protein [Spirochaetales bacterium]